jgi:hypothetical protein
MRAELRELEALELSRVDDCAAPSDGSTSVPDTCSGVPQAGAAAVAIEDTREPREDARVDTGPSAPPATRSERGPSGSRVPAPPPGPLAAEAVAVAAVVALPEGGGSAAGGCPAAGGSWLVGAPAPGSGTFPAVEV